jgi:hypothetical protein
MFNRLLAKLFRLISVAPRTNKMSAKTDDFQPLPTYQETRNSNAAWVQVTLTKVEPDGTRTQTIAIAHKVR